MKVSAETVYAEGESDEQEYIDEKVGPIETFATTMKRRLDGAVGRVINQCPV